MPNNEDLKYKYELDISSLTAGTTKALSALQKQIDALTGVTNKAKSAAASAKVFEKAWLDASGKVSAANARMAKQAEAAQRIADKYLASQAASGKKDTYVPSKIQQQIDAITGVTNKAKSAEASAQAFEKAWLNASDKISGKAKQVEAAVSESTETASKRLDNFKKVASTISQVFSQAAQPVKAAFDPIIDRLMVFGLLIDPNLTKKIQSFKSKASAAFERVAPVLSTCADAFRRTSQDAGDADASSSRLAKTLDKLKSAGSKLVRVAGLITSGLSSAGSSMSKLGDKLKQGTRLFNNLTAGTRKAFRAIQLFSGVSVGKMLSSAVKQSIAYTENMNLFTVAMGDAVDEGTAFVSTMQELYGMDPSNLVRYAGNFYQLAAAIEMPSKQASEMSLSLTKAVNDISSLYNVDMQTVFENLSSGLQGMSRAVTKYGFDIRAVTLQTTAAELGLTQQVESMSEANRIGLRFLTMMKQAANASGDFARTIETPANQLRILKEQFTQLGRAVGNFFVAPIRTCIQYVNGFIMALRTVLTFIASNLRLLTDFTTEIDFNTDSADAAAGSISGIGDAASDTTKKLKSMLAPFDELNILQDQTADSGSSGIGDTGLGNELLDPAIAKAIDNMELKFEDVRMKANEVRDSILEFFGFTVDVGQIIKWNPTQFENNLINKFPQWTKTIQAAFDNWSDIVQGFKNVFNSLSNVLDMAKQKFYDFIAIFINDESVSTWISNLSGNLNAFSAWIDEHSEGISTFVAILMGLVTALTLLSAISPVFSAFGTIVSTVGKVVNIASTGLSVLGTAFSGLSAPVMIAIGVAALFVAAAVAVIATNEDLQQKVSEAWTNVKNTIANLWTNFLKPIIDAAIEVLEDLWNNCIKPIVAEILTVVLDLWNNALAPLVNWIIATFGPYIAGVVRALLPVFSTVFGTISGIITNLLKVLDGVIQFITGVFSGDWSRAWEGIQSIFSGVFGVLGSIAKGALNAVIDAVNTVVSVVWPVIRSIGNAIGSVAGSLGKLLGKSWGWTMPSYPPRIPHLARGGVVSDPTLAMIGEAGRDEAVVPLDNSPQMREFAKSVADAVTNRPDNNGSGNQPIHVHVYIGNEELDEYIYEANTRRDIQTNGGN